MESGYPTRQTRNTQRQDVQREQGGCARQNRRHCGGEKIGKSGIKEQPLIGQILSPVETTWCRVLAATAKFLAIDRGDIVYCAKELTRHMARPTTADWEKMARFGRYLTNRPRVQLWYKFQETPCQLETFSDTDWAGCRRTRRSTTGGYTVAGSHLIKMWCKTQAVVALSSAEAELYGLVTASAETMGLISMCKDLGTHMNTHKWSGIGRCERSPRHCGPTRIGQIEASGHQFFVDPRESSQG